MISPAHLWAAEAVSLLKKLWGFKLARCAINISSLRDFVTPFSVLIGLVTATVFLSVFSHQLLNSSAQKLCRSLRIDPENLANLAIAKSFGAQVQALQFLR